MMQKRSFALRWLTVVAFGLLVGCESSGPEFVRGETVVIEGSLTAEAVQTHVFALTRSGTVQIRLASLVAIEPVTGDPIENPTLIVSLGRPAEQEGQTLCSRTLSQFLAEGDSFSTFLEQRTYCLTTTRPAGFPPEAVVEYTITLEPAFS